MNHRNQNINLKKFLFLLFGLLPASNGMKKVTEYKHHQIEDLCKAGNQQKVQNPQDDDEIKMIDNPVSSSNKKVGRAQW